MSCPTVRSCFADQQVKSKSDGSQNVASVQPVTVPTGALGSSGLKKLYWESGLATFSPLKASGICGVKCHLPEGLASTCRRGSRVCSLLDTGMAWGLPFGFMAAGLSNVCAVLCSWVWRRRGNAIEQKAKGEKPNNLIVCFRQFFLARGWCKKISVYQH